MATSKKSPEVTPVATSDKVKPTTNTTEVPPKKKISKKLIIILAILFPILCIVLTVGAYFVYISTQIINEPVVCDYNGEVYKHGDSFDSTDGCNTCSCGDNGDIACTEMACEEPSPEPTDEPGDEAVKGLTLTGFCGSSSEVIEGDSVNTSDDCVLKEKSSGETVQVLKTCTSGTLGDSKVLCLDTYTAIVLGLRTGDVQYTYMLGGEGGDAWASIFEVNLKTKKVKYVDSYSFSHLAEDQMLYVYKETEECNSIDYQPECEIQLIRKTTADCQNMEKIDAYMPKCFTNWDEIPSAQRPEKEDEFENFGTAAIKFYSLEKKYKLMYFNALSVGKDTESCQYPGNYHTDCILRLIPKDTAECSDPSKPAAYKSTCFENWSKLSAAQKENATANLDYARSVDL